MKRILISAVLALMASGAMAQEKEITRVEPVLDTDVMEDAKPTYIFFPEMELLDGGIDWSDLEHNKYYAISAPAEWRATGDEGGNAEENGWFMDEHPAKLEFISLNEYEDMLSWLELTEEMAEEITDTTAARAVGQHAEVSKHTVEISGEYLDILGTLSGHRQKSRNFQIMKYAGKTIMYDYNNKILRLLEMVPMDMDDIIKE